MRKFRISKENILHDIQYQNSNEFSCCLKSVINCLLWKKREYHQNIVELMPTHCVKGECGQHNYPQQ